jgi:hypothetical protein
MFFLTGGGYSSAACADVNAKEIFAGRGIRLIGDMRPAEIAHWPGIVWAV